MAALVAAVGFTSCSEDDLDTNQYNKGGVNILAFGPMPITRGATMRVTGTELDKVSEVLFPEGNQKISAATTFISADFTRLSSEELSVVVPDLCVPGQLRLKTNDGQIITYGTQYLRFYSFDAMIAGVQFCFSGYFCSYNKAGWAFFHNAVSSVTVRIPGTWLASVMFPLTLTPMGAAAPLGSVLSICICLLVYLHYFRSPNKLQALQGNS